MSRSGITTVMRWCCRAWRIIFARRRMVTVCPPQDHSQCNQQYQAIKDLHCHGDQAPSLLRPGFLADPAAFSMDLPNRRHSPSLVGFPNWSVPVRTLKPKVFGVPPKKKSLRNGTWQGNRAKGEAPSTHSMDRRGQISLRRKKPVCNRRRTV